ncbi:UNVERIFIED_CONTAM: hypothetical protein GTU68_024800 [Idotea baltica]|nr:hypothetical protein [Idotea baltica]
MGDEESKFYIEVYFSGHVQGVGFRYCTLQVAKGYEVTGTVSNLADGRVFLEAEGSERECGLFLRAVQEELETYIRKTEVTEGRRLGKFTRFTIG